MAARPSLCPVLSVPGRLYAVREFTLADVARCCSLGGRRQYDPNQTSPVGTLISKQGGYGRAGGGGKGGKEELVDIRLIVDLVCYIHREDPNAKEAAKAAGKAEDDDDGGWLGAILIFLPGWKEISDLTKALGDAAMRVCGNMDEWRIIPLHSKISPALQRTAFQRVPPFTRKIVVSTNICESSVTVDDVTYVIDAGLHRERRYDPLLREARLETVSGGTLCIRGTDVNDEALAYRPTSRVKNVSVFGVVVF